MKRREAITLLTEITMSCQELAPDLVSLVQSSHENRLSVGYQVHIQAAIDKATQNQIRLITDARSLGLCKEKGRIIIYKPKTVLVDGKPAGF
ncbi:MAG: hypothetical protein ACQCN4_09285 [Candidatus Bathyarchaeia archaeon]|jgi:hypothetical protein